MPVPSNLSSGYPAFGGGCYTGFPQTRNTQLEAYRFNLANQMGELSPGYHPKSNGIHWPIGSLPETFLGIKEVKEEAREVEKAEEKPRWHNGKKLRNPRTMFTEDQIQFLESVFQKMPYLSLPEQERLASDLGLAQRQVKTWFQNRRQRDKKQAVARMGDPASIIGGQGSPSPASVPPQPQEEETEAQGQDYVKTPALQNKEASDKKDKKVTSAKIDLPQILLNSGIMDWMRSDPDVSRLI